MVFSFGKENDSMYCKDKSLKDSSGDVIIKKCLTESNDEKMKIYLKLRPFTEDVKNPYEIKSLYEVSADPPVDSANYKNLLHGNGKGYQNFTFSQIIEPNWSESDIFDLTTKDLLQDFVKGSDRLLFAYGTTSSGKTYTMNSIIPISVFSLFNSCETPEEIVLKPIDFNNVEEIKKQELHELIQHKQEVIKSFDKDKSDIMKNQQSRHLLSLEVNDEYYYQFWISFVEIYNELCYDLLSIGNNTQRLSQNRRVHLDIRTSKNGGFYVKGANCFPVKSAEEAISMLLAGRKQQKIGATRFNQSSSRSHTIFTIKVVRYCRLNSRKYMSRVFNFSFCDLAGSERTNKAQTTGLAQKEASNINNSLLTLGRCIKIMRQNQIQPNNPQIVPFRDSKLTRLFQNYLSGSGRASMIVCINPAVNLFDESLQVLKFSALARKVVIHEKPLQIDEEYEKRRHRLSLLHRLDIEPVDESLIYEDDSETELQENPEDYIKSLEEMIEILKDQLINSRKMTLINENKVREQLEIQYKEDLRGLEEHYITKLDKLQKELDVHIGKTPNTKKRKLEMDIEQDLEELEQENEKLKSQLNEIGEELEEFKQLNEEESRKNELLSLEVTKLQFQMIADQKKYDNMLKEQSQMNMTSNSEKSLVVESNDHATDTNRLKARFSELCLNPIYRNQHHTVKHKEVKFKDDITETIIEENLEEEEENEEVSIMNKSQQQNADKSFINLESRIALEEDLKSYKSQLDLMRGFKLDVQQRIGKLLRLFGKDELSMQSCSIADVIQRLDNLQLLVRNLFDQLGKMYKILKPDFNNNIGVSNIDDSADSNPLQLAIPDLGKIDVDHLQQQHNALRATSVQLHNQLNQLEADYDELRQTIHNKLLLQAHKHGLINTYPNYNIIFEDNYSRTSLISLLDSFWFNFHNKFQLKSGVNNRFNSPKLNLSTSIVTRSAAQRSNINITNLNKTSKN